MQRIHLLGIPIDALTEDEAVARLLSFVEEPKQHHVMTPNSEMLVEASKNTVFREVLQESSLNVPDSAGQLVMAQWTGQHLPERVTGIDTMESVCAVLPPDHPIFLLGAQPGVAERVSLLLKVRNPSLRIAGTYSGSPREEDAPSIIARIHAAAPRILFVAYGAPAQDVWIARHLKDLPSVRIAMGVGGAFDFIAGTQRRAPLFLQRLSLEWLWRLLREPRRWKRIWNAVVVFPILVLRRGRM